MQFVPVFVHPSFLLRRPQTNPQHIGSCAGSLEPFGPSVRGPRKTKKSCDQDFPRRSDVLWLVWGRRSKNDGCTNTADKLHVPVLVSVGAAFDLSRDDETGATMDARERLGMAIPLLQEPRRRGGAI